VKFAFAPYIVTDSGLDRAALERQINAACAYLSAPPFGLANELPRAGEWFAALQDLPGRRFGTVAALATGEGGVNSALRIDIDADLVAALGLAHIASQRGMPASFYVLHTTGYYGRLEADRWRRHGAAAAIYREIQELGCEVGLHTDPYKLYLDDGIDGAAAITTELAWLRAEGLRIAGTSAHNCVPVYGVENFEVFCGHEIRRDGWVSRRGRVAPLGVLDPAALGLAYEAGAARRGPAADDPDRCPFVTDWPVLDLVRDPDWMRQYLHENPYSPWGYEARLWVLGPDRWALSCRTNALTAFLFDRPFAAIRPALAALAPCDRLVITLHPEYFGDRDGPDCYPRGMP
jgi:peptidoglycan/xylan/chitin deacetylase (PgdA/CDA1 family)